MLIDWFTVAAQAFNFLLLVWLMKRFLYKPILHTIAVREQGIAAKVADVEAKKAEAQQEREVFDRQHQALEEQRVALLRRATEEARAERQRLMEEARQAAESWRMLRQETLRNDARNLNHAVSRRAQEEVFATAQKVLNDLAGTTLEQRMCEVFAERLRAIDGVAKAALAKSIKASSTPAVIRSAFALPEEQQAALQQALNEIFVANVPIRFETSPDLICGIELTTHGQKVAWSITDYLGSLERSAIELLNAQARSESSNQTNSHSTLDSKHL